MEQRDQGLEPVRDDFALFDDLYVELRRFAAFVADSDIEPDDLVQDALLATLKRYELSELENPAAYLSGRFSTAPRTGGASLAGCVERSKRSVLR